MAEPYFTNVSSHGPASATIGVALNMAAKANPNILMKLDP
jgi:hypothetical protein